MHAKGAIARRPAHERAAGQQRMSGGTAFGRNFFEVAVLPQFRTHVRLSLITERAARARTVTGSVHAALLAASRTRPVGSLPAAMAYVTLCDAARTWHPRSQVRADQHVSDTCNPAASGTRSSRAVSAAGLSVAVACRAAESGRAGSRRSARCAAGTERSAGSRSQRPARRT